MNIYVRNIVAGVLKCVVEYTVAHHSADSVRFELRPHRFNLWPDLAVNIIDDFVCVRLAELFPRAARMTAVIKIVAKA